MEGGTRGSRLLAEFSLFADYCARFTDGIRQGYFDAASDGRHSDLIDPGIGKTLFATRSKEIAAELSDAKLSFGQLNRALKSGNDRILAVNLKRMVDLGLVYREVVSSKPPRVLYSLSEFGQNLATMSEPILLYVHIISTRRALSEESIVGLRR